VRGICDVVRAQYCEYEHGEPKGMRGIIKCNENNNIGDHI